MVQVKQFGVVSQGECIRWGWLVPSKSKVWLLPICHGFFLFFRKSGCSCHYFSNLVGSVFTHTHALHELSWLSSLYRHGNFCFCYTGLSSPCFHNSDLLYDQFLDRNTCVCYNTCEGSYFAAFSLFSNSSDYVFDNCWTYITLFPGSFWDR
jgi:hypothetical protein